MTAVRVDTLEAKNHRMDRRNYVSDLESKHQPDGIDSLEHRSDE